MKKILHLAGDGYADAPELTVDLHFDGKKRDCYHLSLSSQVTVFDYK